MKKILNLGLVISIIGVSCILPTKINSINVVNAKELTEYTLKDMKNVANYTKLSTGLYWFDETNTPYKDGVINSPFDKTKPTVILVHGWEYGCTKINHFINFNYDYVSKEIRENLVRDWIKKGYNVGIFNWIQLSDEYEVKTAEAKIWTKDYISKGKFWNDRVGMRWKYSDDSFETMNIPKKSAAELFYYAYAKAMKDFKGDEIRIVGHSLGNQMAIRLMDLIDKNIKAGNIGEELMPDRVALLDPYYSHGNKYYLNGSSTSEEAFKIAKRLVDERKIVFEMYKSSSLTNGTLSGDCNSNLEKICYHVDMYPYYFRFYQQGLKHTIPIADYFWSSIYSTQKDKPLMGACLDNSSVGAMMGNAFYWYQEKGHYTIDPKDDLYVPYKLNTYIPQKDIKLSINGNTINYLSRNNHSTLKLKLLNYLKINTEIYPKNATSKIVSFEKIEGDKNCIQLATNGIIKGIKPGKVLLKVYSKNLDSSGNIVNGVEKYIEIEVIL